MTYEFSFYNLTFSLAGTDAVTMARDSLHQLNVEEASVKPGNHVGKGLLRPIIRKS